MTFIQGLITGTAAGILLSPNSGQNNLEIIRKKYPHYKEQVMIAFNDLKKGFKLSEEKLPQEQPMTLDV